MRSLSNLKLHIIFKNQSKTNSFYQEFYSLWREVWDKAFIADFNLHHRLPSDKFSSQDLIIGITNDKIPVAVITLRKIDLNQIIDVESSSLIFWPQNILNQIKLSHRYIYTCENLAIQKDWRKSDYDFSLKDFLFLIVRLVLQQSNTQTGVLSCVRNFKSVQFSSYESGAMPLLTDQIHPHIQNQKVDYVFWDKTNLAEVKDKELLKKAEFHFTNQQQERDYVYSGLRKISTKDEISFREF